MEKHAYDSSDCNIACAVKRYCYNGFTFRVSQCGANLRAREDPRQTTEEVSKICLSNLQMVPKHVNCRAFVKAYVKAMLRPMLRGKGGGPLGSDHGK